LPIVKSPHEISLRHAALVAGLGYLLTPTPFAEFYVWPRLVMPGDAAQTLLNIQVHHEMFAIGIVCYLLSYVLDVVIAWALYYLLKAVSAPLSMLAAWFQLVYAAVGLSASLSLAVVPRLSNLSVGDAVVSSDMARAQVQLVLASFHPTWGLGLIFFGIHLLLVGYLIYKSGYIPKLIGILLALAGAAYIIQNLNAYLFPKPDLGYVAVALSGELVFMFWLLIRGWKIKQTEVDDAPSV